MNPSVHSERRADRRGQRQVHAILALCLVALVSLAVHADGDDGSDPPLADPIPLRRVLLPANRLTAELDRVRDGVLTRMPRKEFESLVQQSARGARDARNRPRLIEAQYHASLVEGSTAGVAPALTGTAQWKILHRGAGPALLRLTGEGSFNLAVKQPRYDNRDALLGSFPDPTAKDRGKSLALLVDQPGDHTLTFEWSARTEQRPEGLIVDLRVPSCPAAALELDLPTDRLVQAFDGTLISGPRAAERPDHRTWRIALGGRTQLPLLLRRNGPGRSEPVVLASQKTVQRVSPEGVESISTFNLEALHQDVSELVVEFDPLLRPVEVFAPHLSRWEITSGGRNGPGLLNVRLSRPLREGVLEVRGLAPLGRPRPASKPTSEDGPRREADQPLVLPWTSPGLRLARAVPRGETLELWLHPDLRLLSWQPGDYRLTDSSVITDGDRKTSMRRLTLQGGALGATTSASRRPGGLVQAGGVEFRARQHSWWRLNADAMELVVQIDYEVRQGQLFQLPLRVPAGWEIETVDLSPTEMLRSWGVRADRIGQLLLVDLRQPLRLSGTRSASSLTVRMRHPGPLPGRDWPFPDVVPVGARFREGGLAIDFDEQVYRVGTRTSAALGEPASTGPWGKSIPDYYHPFQGEGLTGSLRIEARPPRIRARVQTDVLLSAQAGVDTRLVLEAQSGTPTSIDVHLPTGGDRPWNWRVEPSGGGPSVVRVRRVERLTSLEAAARLAPLGTTSPLGSVMLQAAWPGGTCWRLWLDRPLPLRQAVTIHATRLLDPQKVPDSPGRIRWDVPLPTVLGATRQDGETTLYLKGADLVSLETTGLREVSGTRQTTTRATPWRSFRYGDAQARLLVLARMLPPARLAEAHIDRARLLTVLTPEGELRHLFRFRVSRWPQRTLPLLLPAHTRLLAVGVAGRWLEHAALMAEDTLHLPVPAGADPTLLEVLYATPAEVRGPWSRLSAPAPELPIAPASFDRRWLLPPDLQPLGDRWLVSLPGSDSTPGSRPALSRLLDLFRLGPALPIGNQRDRSRLERDQSLVDAFATLRGDHGGTTQRLAAIVEILATSSYLGDRHPLVVDRAGLSRSGLESSSTLRIRPARDGESQDEHGLPWEDNGLVVLPTRAGILLTTHAAIQRWGLAEGDSPPPSIELAAAQAVERGRDSSGRFVSALEWLDPDRPDRRLRSLFLTGSDLDGWTTWAPLAGGTDADLVVARGGTISLLGLLLTGVLAGVFVLLRRRPVRTRLILLLGWLALAGLGLAWLPTAVAGLAWWPLLVGLAIAVPWYLLWASRRVRLPGPASSLITRRSALLGTTGSLGALAVLLAGPIFAQPRKIDPETVFLVPGPADAPDRQSVLVAPRLVEQLRSLARPTQVPTDGAVLVSASYDGKLVGDRAEFAATLLAHSLGEEPATLLLPLDELQLVGDVLLDGVRVLPVALPAPQTGYSLRLRGQGRHKIELRFQVPVTSGSGDTGMKQVRFRVPPLVQSRVSFLAPTEARYLQVPVKFGSQRVTTPPGRTEQRLEAELGAISSPVLIRWNLEATPVVRPRIGYREAYLWDLRPDHSQLTALVRYEITLAAVTSLVLELPTELEVRSAEARRPLLPDRTVTVESRTPTEPVRLSDWTVVNPPGSRTLRLDFPAPVAGHVEVKLEMVPRTSWASPVLLPLPRPHGQAEPRTLGYLAYRTQGLEATRANWLRLTGIRAEEFAPFWPVNTRPLPGVPLEYASSFRRDPRQPPELRVQLRPTLPRLEVMQAVAWQVGAAQAELTAKMDVVAPGKDLSVVEWEIVSVRPLTIASVTGPDVSRWSQTGDRLLVWLEKTTGTARLEISGWVSLVPPLTKNKKPIGFPRLELPCLRPVQKATVRTGVTVEAGPGLTLVPQGLKHLVPDGTAQPGKLRYVARQDQHGGSFLVRPGPAPVAEVVMTARLVGKEVAFTSTIDYRMQGELRSVQVRLRNWEGDARLEAPSNTVARRREQHRRSAERRERSWIMELQPGVVEPYRLKVEGKLELEEVGGSVALPEVILPGVRARQVLVVARELITDVCTGLEETTAPPGAPEGARAWKVNGDDWSLHLMPRDRQVNASPVQVLLSEMRSTIPDGSRWLHEARFCLRQESSTELAVRWPGKIEVVSVHLDGAPVATGPGDPEGPPVPQPSQDQAMNRLWLPLPGPGGIHEVVLRYRYPEGRERLDRPDLNPPRLEAATRGPTVWTVDVPAGWDVTGPGAGQRLGSGATRRAVLELHGATLALARSADLATGHHGSEADLALAQRQFARACWLAEVALASGGDGRRPLGPVGISLTNWLSGLRHENRTLTREQHFDEVRLEAERHRREPLPRFEELPPTGTLFSWQVEKGDVVPAILLTPSSQRQVRQGLMFSGQWLIGLFLVWLVTLSRPLRTLARMLWPEQVVLLALAGWYLAGPTLLMLALLVLGLSGRVAITWQAVETRWRRSAPSSGATRGSTSAGHASGS